MGIAVENSKQSIAATLPAAVSPVRDRLLNAACESYANAGFHGAHLREICKRAGTNVGVICYHFHSKEGLYEAVLMEAGRRVCSPDGTSIGSLQLPPQKRLLILVDSLLQRLAEDGAWIARLLAWELVDPPSGAHNFAASGLEKDFVVLQAVMGECLEGATKSETIQLHALSLINECVVYALAVRRVNHPLFQLGGYPKGRTQTACYLTRRTLGALDRERTCSEDPNP